MTEEKHYVYILECGDGSYYTGWTTHLDERVAKHASGHGAKYTRSHLPVQLVYWECFSDKSGALKRECAIKALTRTEKQKLIMTQKKDSL
ncbi:MAG: GIY-YIG nuclease family protein [Clostridia bacterium]|nr:GIY-YIG nuclease family protein [Clostridia bacterium]